MSRSRQPTQVPVDGNAVTKVVYKDQQPAESACQVSIGRRPLLMLPHVADDR